MTAELKNFHQLNEKLSYHVFNRGNAKKTIFHEHGDYLFFKRLLRKYSVKKKLSIFHYCLMPNHYHLLFEIMRPEALSSVMAGIDKAYSIYHHRKYNTVGYLWQGRFKSKPVQKDTHLTNCGLYIETNPVKGGLVGEAVHYQYSSAAFYALGKSDKLVIEDVIFNDLGLNDAERRNEYKNFLTFIEEEEREKYLIFGSPLGNEYFKSRLYKNCGRYYPRRKGKPRKIAV